jgi:Cu/Ag efflux pump CusA
MLAMHGLSVGRFGELVETAFRGLIINQIYLDPAVFDLVVRYPEEYRASPDAIRSTPVEVEGGHHVRIGDLAEVVSVSPQT